MRRWVRIQCARIFHALRPKPDLEPVVRDLSAALADMRHTDNEARDDYMESISELREARQMAGTGPWTIGASAAKETDAILNQAYESYRPGVQLKESSITATGAMGDIDLMLENIGWRREASLAWMEFSRWGIQQIILICRLNYIKNPYIRRCIDICASYVFGRGVEVSSDNQAADDVIKDYFERNSRTLGHVALVALHKRKYYDGNIFWVNFTDTENSGQVTTRTIDATEIQDIITDTQDSDTPWFYRRTWLERSFDPRNGSVTTKGVEAYYPDIDYNPDEKIPEINGKPVMWENPILHRKCGAIAKWHFGCPLIYPALPWAKTARRLLESIYTVKKSLANIAWSLTTKGGQQAIQGAKATLQTTVGPSNIGGVWDTQPPAGDGSTFASGPGTKLEPMKTAGAGGNPEDVRRYIHCICMTVGIPETWLADASVGSLATALSLDRPTELNFKEQQEEWTEDLKRLTIFALVASNKAVGGKLREAWKGINAKDLRIMECARVKKQNGTWVYEASKKENTIQVKVLFPEIREGDMPANVKAIVESMTLDNKGGQIVGIDEKVGCGLLFAELGYENYEDILDKMYPDKEYDPDRTTAPLPAPIGKAEPDPGGEPQDPGGKDPKPTDKKVAAAEQRISRNRRGVLIERLREAIRKLGRAA